MKKNLSNDEMKNIVGGYFDYSQRRISNWEYTSSGGGVGGSNYFKEAIGKFVRWLFWL